MSSDIDRKAEFLIGEINTTIDNIEGLVGLCNFDRFIQTNVLVALLDDDVAEASKLLDELTMREAQKLLDTAIELVGLVRRKLMLSGEE